jgi:hypothetical protein
MGVSPGLWVGIRSGTASALPIGVAADGESCVGKIRMWVTMSRSPANLVSG